METNKDKVVEILKEFSHINVKTDEPEEVWVMSSSTIDDTFDKVAEEIDQLYSSGEEVSYDGYADFDWDSFIQYGLDNSDNIVDGMPWSFDFYGHPVTHENDNLYLIDSGTIQFKPEDRLWLFKDKLFHMTCETLKQIQAEILDVANAPTPEAIKKMSDFSNFDMDEPYSSKELPRPVVTEEIEFDCPECGERIQYGLSQATLERMKQSKLFTRPVDQNEVTEEEINQVIDDVCVLQERIAIEYQRNTPRAVEIDKLRARQRKAILELLNKKR